MATERANEEFINKTEALRAEVLKNLGGELAGNPSLADPVTKKVDDMFESWEKADAKEPPPPDRGLAELVGIGPQAATDFGQTRLPPGVRPYDETVASERIIAMADLYYIYQHERIGIFRVMRKLQELFQAGTLRLSSGPGAYGLYQFDRRQVLRFTRRERLAAYCRAFGYCYGPAPSGARPNREFHPMFTNYVDQVAQFWRDKRISDVIRERAYDPSFGSIAVVRRSGLDLRNNLRWASYGHLNVLRVEVMQLLEEAFRILDTEDLRRQFGADNAWDVVEEVLSRYFQESLATSPRQRMGVAGRQILRWLSQPHILQTTRTQFEALLIEIAEYAEEWLTSAQSLGVTVQPRGRRRESASGMWTQRPPFGQRVPVNGSSPASASRRRAPRPAEREYEFECEM